MCICTQIERGSVYVERLRDREREIEREREGRGPGTVRVWSWIRLRVRVICHFVFWHFVLWHFVRLFIFWHFVRDSITQHNCSVYTVQCTVYTVHCAVCSVLFICAVYIVVCNSAWLVFFMKEFMGPLCDSLLINRRNSTPYRSLMNPENEEKKRGGEWVRER